jgi:hypothetical protein
MEKQDIEFKEDYNIDNIWMTGYKKPPPKKLSDHVETYQRKKSIKFIRKKQYID